MKKPERPVLCTAMNGQCWFGGVSPQANSAFSLEEAPTCGRGSSLNILFQDSTFDMSQTYILKIILSIFILFIFNSQGKALYASKRVSVHNKEVIFICEESLKPVAEDSIEIYSHIKTELEKMLKWSVFFKPTIILINDSTSFQKITGNSYIVAFAQPERDLIVIDYSKMKTDPFTLDGIMKHELCHLLLHKYIDGENLPKWLDEGIAQFVSGGLVDIIMDRKRTILSQAILSEDYIGIRFLEKRFPSDRKSSMLAYAESKSLVEYIIQGYEIDGLLKLVEDLRQGSDIDSAVFNSLSISYDKLEDNWINDLRKGTSWPYFLINYLYEILFFIGAILLILGFIKVFQKKREYNLDEDDSYGSDS